MSGDASAVQRQLLAGRQRLPGEDVEHGRGVDRQCDPGERGAPLPAPPVDRTGTDTTAAVTRSAPRSPPLDRANSCRRRGRLCPPDPRRSRRSPDQATPDLRSTDGWPARRPTDGDRPLRSRVLARAPRRTARGRSPRCGEHDPCAFFDEAEFDRRSRKGPGYWALTRYDDVWHGQPQPAACSAPARASNIADLPDRDRRVLRLDDHHGRSPPRPAALASSPRASRPRW